jgi:hypothetical protein
MKTKIVLIILITWIGVSLSCNDKDQNNPPGTTETVYKGTGNMTIQYYDYDIVSGHDVFIEGKSYQFPVVAITGPYLKEGNNRETNVFNLVIGPDRDLTTDEEGHIDIISAMLFNTSTGRLLLQYWDLAYNNNQLTGTLSDMHLPEAAAGNILWAWEDVAGIIITSPFPLGKGTQMSGTLDQKTISLHIWGESNSTYRKFDFTMQATAQ